MTLSAALRHRITFVLNTFRVLLVAGAIGLLTGCGSPSNTNSNGGNGSSGAPKTLAVWSNSSNGIPFTMVGTDPSIPGTGTTNIAVELIPVSLNFSAVNLVISSTGPACADTIPIVERVVNSPVFASNPWTDVTGSINIGNVQFGDAFQRMNFWAFVSSQSPNYHVNLQPVTVENPISVDVPPGIGATLTPSPTCPSQMIGAIPSSLMDSAVQNAISAMNITPDTLPIFLTYDISFVPENFLGYHNVQGGQSYIVASYIDVGFTDPTVAASDVAVLTHEVGEWLDDPFLSNNVPPWGGFGIQPTCSPLLEVGDPLSRSIFSFQTADFDYHFQELAFVWWFTRDVPSLAVNGQYSMAASFPTPAPLCQ